MTFNCSWAVLQQFKQGVVFLFENTCTYLLLQRVARKVTRAFPGGWLAVAVIQSVDKETLHAYIAPPDLKV